MADKYRFHGIKAANEDVKATSDAINALLTGANVTTINVSGKDLPATSDDVPNALKVAAFAATVKVGSADAQISTMAANNQILADQADALEKRAVVAETNASTLLSEKTELEGALKVEKATTSRLSAEISEISNLRKAANDEAARVTGQLNAVNSELSKRCLAVNALVDLRNEKNELLVSSASQGEREKAADRIAPADKINALCGSVNSALVRAGLDVRQLPVAGSAIAANVGDATLLSKLSSTTDPLEKTKLRAEHMDQLRAGFVVQQSPK